MELPFVVGAVLAVILFRTLVKRLLYPRPIPGIPYDAKSAQRITGDVPAIAATYKECTELALPLGRRSLKYGSPVHQVFMRPFSKPFVMINDLREATDLLLRRNKEFDKSMSLGVWQTFIPHSTIAQKTTPQWKAQRKTWQDTMHPDFLRRVVAKHIYTAAQDLTRLWEARNSKSSGLPVDVSGDFSYAAFDAIWTATFGEQLDLANAQMQMVESGKEIQTKGLDMHSTVQYINELANSWRSSYFPALTRWRIRRSAEFRNYIQKVLNGSSDGEEHDTCAMDLILRRSMLAAQKAGKPVPDPTKDQNMRDELLLFIYAGHDTTSTTLQWFVKFMTNYPEAQSKLRSALRAAFPGDGLPDVEQLIAKDVPYLSATIEETLRLAATIAEELRSPSSRAALEKSGGVDWSLKPSAQDLDKFAPERWLKANEEGDQVFDGAAMPQLAFAGGNRGCFGRRLAMMELRIMIVLVVMRFKFLPVPPELNSFQVNEQLLRPPQQCFVKLEAA
ncbi:cytochrome P450 [Hypoxylon sp. FL1284]|nr:cytochrome P450 [Hypoxylon sp. FL1284]